jgi:hypothetical protein
MISYGKNCCSPTVCEQQFLPYESLMSWHRLDCHDSCLYYLLSVNDNSYHMRAGSTDRNHDSSLYQDIKISYGKNCCSQTAGRTDRNHDSLVYVKTLSSHMVRIVLSWFLSVLTTVCEWQFLPYEILMSWYRLDWHDSCLSYLLSVNDNSYHMRA